MRIRRTVFELLWWILTLYYELKKRNGDLVREFSVSLVRVEFYCCVREYGKQRNSSRTTLGIIIFISVE